MENFLEHHRRACSVQRERESVARESVARQLETMPEEPELKM